MNYQRSFIIGKMTLASLTLGQSYAEQRGGDSELFPLWSASSSPSFQNKFSDGSLQVGKYRSHHTGS